MEPDRDLELTIGSDRDLSVDDILAEFQAEQPTRAPALDEPYSFLPDDGYGDEDEDVRVYAPGAPEEAPYAAPESARVPESRLSAMEQEARSYIAQMQQYEEEPEPAPEEDYGYAPEDADYGEGESAPEPGSLATDFGPYPEVEIDSRFNLGGQYSRHGISYGDRDVDISPEEGYTPTAQKSSGISHWAPDRDPFDEGDDDDRPARKKSKKKKKDKNKKADQLPADEAGDGAESFGFRDEDAAPFEYAPVNGSRYEVEDPGYFPPSFREYVASLVASLFLRLRGTAPGDAAGTMNDSAEDLGPEVTPAAASKYYGSFLRSQKLRLRISAALLVLLCYITLGLPVPGMLRYTPVTAMACCALELTVMLLSLDSFTTGILSIFRLRIGADALAAVSCLVTLADGLIVALSDTAAAHMPLCALSCMSLLGVSFASSLNTKALRKATRVPAIGRRFYSVTGEIKFKDKQLTLLKSLRSAAGFVRRAEEAPPDETLFIKLGPMLLLLALLMSTVISAVQHNYADYVYILSAVLVPAAPVAALSSFALPFFLGSMRIFKCGGAIAGWSGVCDIGLSRNLIVTDRDLFPEGSVTLEGIRIFADESSETVIAYAGTLICASGSCASGCFSKLMEENHCTMKAVEAFEHLPGGGMRGVMDGRTVLCGSTDLMRLMNVRIPYRLVDKTSVLLAIDGVLFGIFAMKYTAQPQVRQALVELVRSSRHPVFAVRDFNVTPEMLHNTFDLATDGYDFPPYVERFGLSEPSEGRDGKLAAIICSEGLGPLTRVADMGRGVYVATRMNLLISVLAAVLGVFAVFIKLLTAGCVSAGFLMLFMAVWAVPALVMSLSVLLRQ